MGAWKKEGPLRAPLEKERNGPAIGFKTAPSSNGRTPALTGREVRVRIPAGLPRIEFSGTAVVAPATAPLNRPGGGPEANDHPANINLAGLICQSLAEAIPFT